MTQNDANPNLIIFEQFPCFAPLEILITWSPFIAVGYYRTAVGYYRVIAQKTLKSKSSHKDLFKTPKNIKIGPVTVENDKNENGRIFFAERAGISGDLRSGNDVCI